MTGFSRVTPTLRVTPLAAVRSGFWMVSGRKPISGCSEGEQFHECRLQKLYDGVNNLNKRMGELRDTNGDAGAGPVS